MSRMLRFYFKILDKRVEWYKQKIFEMQHSLKVQRRYRTKAWKRLTTEDRFQLSLDPYYTGKEDKIFKK